MSIYEVLQMFGGLAFFLYGMNVMSSSLEKMAGGSLENTMKKMTSKPLLSFLLGALITIAIQSSSGVMVMLVGLVNSGIIGFTETLPIIMGTNVGTTVTSWVLTLMGVSSDHFSIISLLSPKCLSPIMAFAGIVLRMVAKSEKKKDIGTIFVGFAVLMYGMTFMSSAMSGLADIPQFRDILTMFTNPLLALLVATVFTGIIQSSAATIGIVQSLSLSGLITYQVALPLVLGANIGTCVTSVLSSIGTSKNAKRVSMIHIYVNCLGALIITIAQLALNSAHMDAFLYATCNTVNVALIHTFFNIFNTVLALIFGKLIILLVRKTIKDETADLKVALVDERLLARPAIAVNECYGNVMVMSLVAKESFEAALQNIFNYSEETVKKIEEGEKMLDSYEDELDTFLVKLGKSEMSDKDSETVNKMLHVINDFERIGDHAMNLMYVSKKLQANGGQFSDVAQEELKVLSSAMSEILDLSVAAFNEDNCDAAKKVEPLEEVIDGVIAELTNKHIERLRKGECQIDLGMSLSEVLNNCERVSDHCSNVAVAVIEGDEDEFNTHKYLHKVKRESKTFKQLYSEYSAKYEIK